ncbi:ABC transporter permease [soil metagenome]
MSDNLSQAVSLAGKSERILTPDPGWFHFNFREVWDAREIAFRFAHRDLTSSFKQTVLGPMWLILPPIFTALTFTIVFGQIAAIPTDGAPQFLFYMLGSVFWSFFSSCITKTSGTFVGNGGIFGKVYFPRLTVPVASILFNLAQLSIQFLLFAGFYVVIALKGAHISLNLAVVFLPLVVIQLAVLGSGIGSFFSSLTVKYRDLSMMLGFGMQLWMYASCIIFPLSSVPEKWRWLCVLNPVVPVIEFARYACFGVGSFEPGYLVLSAAVSALALFVGLTAFKRMEATFMDTV